MGLSAQLSFIDIAIWVNFKSLFFNQKDYNLKS